MGERRLRAARAAGLETVPAIVRDTTDDAMLRDALLENIHRVQLNPLEEAAAYQQLLEEFGATHEELASRIGRSRSQVTNTIRLMKLPVKVQTRVAAGVISAGHARALLGLPDAEAQDALATRIVAEGMSVRATEEAVAMAAAEQPAAKRRTRKISAPGVEELGSRLSDRFETKVKIQIGRSKGKIVVEFGSVDDLQRIIGVMAPEITGRRELILGFRHRRNRSRPGTQAVRSAPGAGPAREQPGEDLAELVAGGLDRHREHRRLGEPGRDVHLEEVDLAVGGDDRVGAGEVGQAEHLVHLGRPGRRRGCATSSGTRAGAWYSVSPGVYREV